MYDNVSSLEPEYGMDLTWTVYRKDANVDLQLGKKTKDELITSLEAVGYPFSEESDNPAYQLFLR